MTSYKWKSSTVLYSLSSFKDSELKLKFKLKLESELESKLLLLSVSGLIRADTYQMSVDHKGDTWIATDRQKYSAKQLLLCHSHGADYVCQLHNCFSQIEGPEAYQHHFIITVVIYGCIAGAASPHFKVATWWAWSSGVKVTCVTSQSTVLQLQWPWLTVWLLVWWCWWRRWLMVVLRFNKIFLILVTSLCFTCYSLADNACLTSNNSCNNTHLLHCRYW